MAPTTFSHPARIDCHTVRLVRGTNFCVEAPPMEAQNERAQLLRTLHQPARPLILCNVYDAATAHLVASNPACKAIATASYAVAAVQGVEDDSMTLNQNLDGVRKIIPIALEHAKPITIDLQDGYRDQLEYAIEQIVELGAVGCNLEDKNNVTGKLYDIEEATERVRRALAAANKKGVKNFILNARTDVLLMGGSIEDAVKRARAYLDAGATTAFVWGGSKRGGISKDEVVQLTKALNGRLNVKLSIGPGYLTVNELREIGVARISVGPELYKKAMEAFEAAANVLLTA